MYLKTKKIRHYDISPVPNDAFDVNLQIIQSKLLYNTIKVHFKYRRCLDDIWNRAINALSFVSHHTGRTTRDSWEGGEVKHLSRPTALLPVLSFYLSVLDRELQGRKLGHERLVTYMEGIGDRELEEEKPRGTFITLRICESRVSV